MKHGNDFTRGPILKKYIWFIIPIVLSSSLQQLYNTADTMVVGKFVSEDALAAVGSTVALTNLILNLFVGLAVGTNVVCAQCFGADDKTGLQRAIHTSYVIALVSGVLLAGVGWFCSGTFLEMMATDPNVIDQATIYMQVFFLGTPASLVYNFGAAILRAQGDTKRPLYILALSGLVNVGLNLFCVMVLNLGVIGVALGTIASQIISAVAVTIILIRTKNEFQLKPSKIRLHKKEFGRILGTGIPSGVSGIMFSLSNVIIQRAINSWGAAAVAGNVAAANVEIFGFLILSAAEQGTVCFVGQNFGARNFERIRKVTWISLGVAFVGAVIFGVATLAAGPTLLGLFSENGADSQVVKYGMIKMTILMYSYAVHAPSTIFGGVLKGIGKAVVNTIVNGICICLLRVVWILWVYPLHPTFDMIYYSYPVTWGSASVVVSIVYIFIRRNMFKKLKQEIVS